MATKKRNTKKLSTKLRSSRKKNQVEKTGLTKPSDDTAESFAQINKKFSSQEFLDKVNGLINAGELDEAYEWVDKANIKKWQKLNFKAIISQKKKDWSAAEEFLLQAIREPDCKAVANKHLGLVYVMQGKLSAALPFLDKAYKELSGTGSKEFDLKLVQAYLNCLLDISKTERVLEIADDLEKLFPGDRSIRVSKASALRSVGRREESIKLLDELIDEYPDLPIVYRIKADVLGDTSPTDALPLYEQALALSIKNSKNKEPDPAIQWNMSLHLLRVRDIARGWECWEQGFHPVVGTMGRNMPHRIKKLKRADSTAKSRIDSSKWTIVISEQGIGDQILFLSVMNEAIEEFKKILFIAEKRMHPILKRSFPKLLIAGAGLTYNWERASLKKNGYIPLGSLPRRYRPDLQSFESKRSPFLIADKTKYQKYREILKKNSGGRPIIGISWKGGYWAIQRKTKQLELEKWMPIFKKDAMYINLQYGDITQELRFLKEKKQEIHVFQKIDFRHHLDDWLAIAAACDGIISVSTALVHFAGAIGQKVAVVMPGKHGPWHLGMTDSQSIAYKNVRIFRPTDDEPLEKVVNRVADLIIK